MEDPVIHRNYVFLLCIFVTFATDSQGTWTLSYIFFTVINCDMKKESENMFFLFSYKKLSAKDQLAIFSMSTSWSVNFPTWISQVLDGILFKTKTIVGTPV